MPRTTRSHAGRARLPSSDNQSASSQQRLAKSRDQAEAAAPAPKGSYLTYGIVGITATGVAVWAIASFYALDLRPYGLATIALLAAAFVGGMVVRGKRKVRHRQALHAAYAEREPVVAPKPNRQ